MIIEITLLIVFLIAIVAGEKLVDKKLVLSGKQAMGNVMGEVGKLELLAFPAGLNLVRAAGKIKWVKSMLPGFGIENLKEVDFPTAMKAYGLSCSLLAGVIGGILLIVSENKGMEPFLFYFAAVAGAFFIPGSKLKKSMIERDRMIKRVFPRLIDQVIILLEAGYSMAMIWRHFANGLSERNSVEIEVKKLANLFVAGMGEEELYEELSRKLNSAIVMKFCNLCRQSLKKGSVDLIFGVREVSSESWQERKWDAVKMGEEASGKMIAPLMLVFIGVLIIVMVPAILQLGMI